MTHPTPARAAREAAGLSLPLAARRAGVAPAYLARCESAGAPYVLALRLAAIYGCSLSVFLPRRRAGVGMPEKPRVRCRVRVKTHPGAEQAGQEKGGRRAPRRARE